MRHHSADKVFIILICLITLLGFAALLSASLIMGKTNFDDPYHYLKHQLLTGGLVGAIGFLIASKVYYRKLEKFSWVLILIGIVLMILTLTPLGVEIKGATRWINIAGFQFQPSEVLKFAFIIYISALFANKFSKNKGVLQGLIPFLIILAVICGLFILQKSTSSMMLIVITAALLFFLSGAKMKEIFIVGILIVALLAVLIIARPYQMKRFLSFMDSDSDPQGRDYHINQSLIAIGSGGVFGVGFGNAISKYNYLPEPMGDSIFAVIAQEFGFIGSVFVLLLYLIIFIKGMAIAKASPDKFSYLTVTGIMSVVLIQALVNIGAMTKLIPLTGQPLPFISYGGTNLAVLLTSMGIIVNISKYS